MKMLISIIYTFLERLRKFAFAQLAISKWMIQYDCFFILPLKIWIMIRHVKMCAIFRHEINSVKMWWYGHNLFQLSYVNTNGLYCNELCGETKKKKKKLSTNKQQHEFQFFFWIIRFVEFVPWTEKNSNYDARKCTFV